MSTMTVTRDDRAAIDKAFSLLSSFGAQASTGVGVSELARRSELSKSTTFRVLKMLERNGAVERVGSNYRFGRHLAQLGTAVYAPGHELVRDVLTPFLADVYEQTHQTVHLAALHSTEVVYLAKLYGHHGVTTPSRVGGRVPAHCTAVGKVLLAYAPDAFDLVLEGPMESLTDRSITDPVVLTSQIVKVRREGLAFECGESSPGVSCVAVPVIGVTGRPVAALSVSIPCDHVEEHRYAAALRQVSHVASQTARRAGLGATVGRSRAS